MSSTDALPSQLWKDDQLYMRTTITLQKSSSSTLILFNFPIKMSKWWLNYYLKTTLMQKELWIMNHSAIKAHVTSAIHIPSFSYSYDALCEKQTEFKWSFTDHLLQWVVDCWIIHPVWMTPANWISNSLKRSNEWSVEELAIATNINACRAEIKTFSPGLLHIF